MEDIYNNYRMVEEVKERAVDVVQVVQSLKAMTEQLKLNGVQVWKNTPPGLVIIMDKF